MDAPRAFNYVFDDKGWLKKLFIGGVISLVPLLNLAWIGYIVKLLSNVSERKKEPLPDWSDFGKKFVDGLLITAAGFILLLPAIIPVVVSLGGAGIASINISADLKGLYYGAFAGLTGLLLCLVFLYLLAFTFYFPALMTHYSRQDRFGACFEGRKILSMISANRNEFVTAWLVSLVTWFVLTFIASFTIPLLVATCCGIPLAMAFAAFVAVWPATVYGYLFGQVGAASSS